MTGNTEWMPLSVLQVWEEHSQRASSESSTDFGNALYVAVWYNYTCIYMEEHLFGLSVYQRILPSNLFSPDGSYLEGQQSEERSRRIIPAGVWVLWCAVEVAEVEEVVVVGSQGRPGELLLGLGPAGAQRHQQLRVKSPGGSVQHRRQLEGQIQDGLLTRSCSGQQAFKLPFSSL